MSGSVELLKNYEIKVKKALGHLEFSIQRVQGLSTTAKDLSELDLERWESFASRLARVVDLFLTKYVKLRVKLEDPGFDGSLRDFCNFAEKIKVIESADEWVGLRELRNSTVHDYEEQELGLFFERLRKDSVFVVKEIKQLKL